jgi:aryl-alcohol dehydrogenase-like predicted oxidoreductase
MKYRTLGKTGLRVSVIGMGTWQLGGEWGKAFTVAETTAMLAKARETGINFLDTAECYGDHVSESLLGSAIASGEVGSRNDWIIATKFGHTFHGHMKRTDDRSAADVTRQLEASLKALKTDYIDLYQFHSIRDAEFDNAELRRALEDSVSSGKVRHLGNSIANSGAVGDGRYQVDGSAAAKVETIQIVYNRLDRKPEEYVLQSCQRQNLGVLARVPLASGFLSGKYKASNTSPQSFPEGDVRRTHDPAKTAARLREVEQIQKTEVPPGIEMSHWALAWCLLHPAVSCVIPGCKSVEQVVKNAAAADLDMVSTTHQLAVK